MTEVISLRAQVEAAVADRWPAFAARHPRLAEQLDQPFLIQLIHDRLRDDPAYQSAMAQALAAGRSAESIGDLLEQIIGAFVGRFLNLK